MMEQITVQSDCESREFRASEISVGGRSVFHCGIIGSEGSAVRCLLG